MVSEEWPATDQGEDCPEPAGDDRLGPIEPGAGGLEAAYRTDSGGYPPYNIELTGEDRYRITLAVAGFSADEIDARVREMGAEITGHYGPEADVLILGLLKGSFIFLADLARRLTVPHRVEFIAVSSYGNSSHSSGAVRLVMDVRGNIEGKHVLIVEDIVDTGHTLKYLIGIIKSHRPASVKTCALVRKAERAEVEVDVDYLGFDIGDDFVASFGSCKGSLDGLQITQQFLICVFIDMKKHIGQIYIYSLVHFTSFLALVTTFTADRSSSQVVLSSFRNSLPVSVRP